MSDEPAPGPRPLPDPAQIDWSEIEGPVLDEFILGAPREFTRDELVEATGLDPEESGRLWRALGFPDPAPDERVFTRVDLEAARKVVDLTREWLPEHGPREAVARAIAQSLSRLAEWQVGMLAQVAAAHVGELTPLAAARLAAEVLPELESLQSYVWRRHLAATAVRWTAGAQRSDGELISADTWPLSVGFADMVGFTRTTRRRSMAELGEMIERFSDVTNEVIANGRGRIIKTVGDEVLFATEHPADAAAIALGLRDRVRIEPSLPPLRIGIAHGMVLARYGDVYGEVVNVASRLTSEARPDTVLVDREMHESLRDDPRFDLRRIATLHTRGYTHLRAWALRGARER
ncbi:MULTISPECIES: adenylate/guanylate cyclase domain-containing protein [Pseudonocardia]|uniref:pH-sensitive adenylate cyclase n=2 Tax=Pseudonocardia TaxID=1847 RepID=A0A1Y2MV66_PSEAH|nr:MULTISPECIES: adenylate/guanylate cyclase domain-containing protein [Pseudonocardia]OSY39073.1 pH-sensitive adenylate cyclase [Pseudonocardia autotrophica]TDN71331.1 adenylate cyclase [Pseudonocardia autotrophica]BBG02005.1 adenylate/guanylate cyclase domain-containing protein [Pseudonocardia autotrophica]GEC23169.1 adenylate/guanylate cyclase domain-containing protein [Pseudonocardia saturnea]